MFESAFIARSSSTKIRQLNSLGNNVEEEDSRGIVVSDIFIAGVKFVQHYSSSAKCQPSDLNRVFIFCPSFDLFSMAQNKIIKV